MHQVISSHLRFKYFDRNKIRKDPKGQLVLTNV